MPLPLAERFHESIEKSDDGCWLWTRRSKTAYGYGQIWELKSEGGRKWESHRLSWTLHRGPIPAGMSVLHRCDIAACCNPDHLFLGNQQDNMRDMREKGRNFLGYKLNPPRGELNRKARFTEDDVRRMRALRAQGMNYAAIGRLFQADRAVIHNIVIRKSWKHVE